MSWVKIEDRQIGHGLPPFIVAEVGINHNGEIEKALEMIEIAHDAGVDAVKFQTFQADEILSDQNLKWTYHSQGKEITESMHAMFKRCELPLSAWPQLKKRCEEKKLVFLSTPQNPSDLKILLEVGVSAIKIGSDDLIHTPLLKHYAKTSLPLIISSGMATLAEIDQALEAIGTFRGYPTLLLACTSQYPTPIQDVNLLKIKTLQQTYPQIPIGFSDHTEGPLASSLAVSLGGCFFEKHFTLSHDLRGPDHAFSEDPQGLKNWVHSIRTAFRMLGCAQIRPTAEEEKMRILARRSIVALKNIPPGEALSEENLALRRPGSGLPPSLLEKILGLQAQKPIAKGQTLTWGDFG